MEVFIKENIRNVNDFRRWYESECTCLRKRNQAVYDDSFSEGKINYRIEKNKDWYGKHIADIKQLENPSKEYSSPELIEKVLNQVEQNIDKEIVSNIKKRKITYNENIGIFSFDRAMMGMYRRNEFFSKKHNRKVDFSEVIEKESKYFLKSDNSQVFERPEQTENGKPKVRTTNKKIFALIEPYPMQNRSLELFIIAGANSDTNANQMIYTGVSGIAIANVLEQKGIKVKINLVVGSNYRDKITAIIIPAKNYGETIDQNLIALITSEPSFFRYEGFKAIISVANYFKKDIPKSLGSLITEDDFYDYIVETEWFKDLPSGTKIVTSGIFSENEAVTKVNEILQNFQN